MLVNQQMKVKFRNVTVVFTFSFYFSSQQCPKSQDTKKALKQLRNLHPYDVMLKRALPFENYSSRKCVDLEMLKINKFVKNYLLSKARL